MKIKYSALVSATSGKLNGSVAASNRGGAYLRNKGVTSNPQTVSQQANRSMFGSISSQFRSLTQAQIAAWNAAAQDFPVIDRFGDTRYLSGLALFVQLNKNLADIGLPPIENPPVKQSFPAITSVSASVEVTAGSLSEFEVVATGDSNFSGTTVLLVKATRPVTLSINYVKNLFRNLGWDSGVGSSTITFEGLAVYQDLFGNPPVGQKVALECVLVSTVSGEKTAPFIIDTIVTAGT